MLAPSPACACHCSVSRLRNTASSSARISGAPRASPAGSCVANRYVSSPFFSSPWRLRREPFSRQVLACAANEAAGVSTTNGVSPKQGAMVARKTPQKLTGSEKRAMRRFIYAPPEGETREQMVRRGLQIKQIVSIGRKGISDGVMTQIYQHWRTYDLVKLKLQHKPLRRFMSQIADELALGTGGEVLCNAGTVFVLRKPDGFDRETYRTDQEVLREAASRTVTQKFLGVGTTAMGPLLQQLADWDTDLSLRSEEELEEARMMGKGAQLKPIDIGKKGVGHGVLHQVQARLKKGHVLRFVCRRCEEPLDALSSSLEKLIAAKTISVNEEKREFVMFRRPMDEAEMKRFKLVEKAFHEDKVPLVMVGPKGVTSSTLDIMLTGFIGFLGKIPVQRVVCKPEEMEEIIEIVLDALPGVEELYHSEGHIVFTCPKAVAKDLRAGTRG